MKKTLISLIAVLLFPTIVLANNNSTLIGEGSLPTTFDLRNVDGNNYLNAVRNQGISNSCWAFATTDAVYSSFMYSKKTSAISSTAYSPAHIEMIATNEETKSPLDLLKFNRNINQGGTYEISAAYLMNLKGPILEEDLPFDKYLEYINLAGSPHEGYPVVVDESKKEALNLDTVKTKKPVVEVKDIAIYNNMELLLDGSYVGGTCTPEIINLIKSTIMENGPVASRIYLDNSNSSIYFSTDRQYYNYNETDYESNHGVTIVGWDDNTAASNFGSMAVPEHNGSWLVKNSYGEGSGDNGYLHISYEDNRICNIFYSFYNIDDEVADNAYYYDYLGSSGEFLLDRSAYSSEEIAFFNSKSNIYVANKFKRNGTDTKEEVDRVTMYFPEAGVNYEIYYSSTGTLEKGIKIGEGTATRPGYVSNEVEDPDGYPIVINNSIENGNEYYTIVYKLIYTNGLFDHPIASAAPVTTPQVKYFSNYETTPNVSYIYVEGLRGWIAFTDPSSGNAANLTIRVYTNNTTDTNVTGTNLEHTLIPTITGSGSSGTGNGTGEGISKETLEMIDSTTHEITDATEDMPIITEEVTKNLNYDTTINPKTGAILSVVFLLVSIASLIVVKQYQRKKIVKFKI